MDVNMDIGLKLINITIVMLSALLNIYLFFKTKQDKRFATVEESIHGGSEKLQTETAQRKASDADLVLRVTVLETRIEQLPTHDDVSELHKRISELTNMMSAVNERSSSTNNSVHRIERYLLENK